MRIFWAELVNQEGPTRIRAHRQDGLTDSSAAKDSGVRSVGVQLIHFKHQGDIARPLLVKLNCEINLTKLTRE